MFLAVGCGVLLILGAASAGWFFYSASRAVSSIAAMVDGGVPLTIPSVAMPTAEQAPDPGAENTEDTADAGVLSPTPPTGFAPGPSCPQAAACCKALVTKAGANPAAVAACDNLLKAPGIGCAQALETYKRTAPVMGAKCPP